MLKCLAYSPINTNTRWLALFCILIDLFYRRIVGGALSGRIDTELALDALQMATSARPVAAGLMHHTDRDSRCASDDYQAVIRQPGMNTSMGRKADC